jgi:hypothetical protein
MRCKTQLHVITRAQDGKLRIRQLSTADPLLRLHTQIGVEDCSPDPTLRGLPVFRELVGPIPVRRHVARYETPEIFEANTRKWSLKRAPRRRRKRLSPRPSS